MARRFFLSRPTVARLDIEFERELNHQQLEAATCGEGPKLVIAGAGTGKTRTLTYRVAHLITRGLAPEEILLVTFTNKAAREMLARVHQLTRVEASQLWGGTFHSVGARLLRRHGHLLGFSQNFSILDERDQRDLLRLCTTDVEVAVERRRFPSPRMLGGVISFRANTGLPLEDILAARYPRFLNFDKEISSIACAYQARKMAANAMDYDDLLAFWLRLLRKHPEVAARYGQQFRAILVDEYQDTNRVQGEIIEQLAAHNGGNLMVVGDDCQSIYAFRGAHHDNILRFPERNPDTEIFKLEINYRSTPEILDLTNASSRCNPERFPKRLSAHRCSGMLPALVPCNYPEQESAFVAERILQLRDEGVCLSRIAVLYRAHSHRLSLETTLVRYDIPYEIRGGVRFFEQAHIKDVVAHLRLLSNSKDEIAFRRVLMLQRGVGNVTASRIWSAVGVPSSNISALLAGLESEATVRLLRPAARRGWGRLTNTLRNVAEVASAPEDAIRVVLSSGYADYVADQFPNSESRLEDLEQLAIFADQYESLTELLAELLLLGELYGKDAARGGDEEDSIILSTVHQAKGLEWDVVFVIHLVEGAIPSTRGLEEDGGEEEERRIFYVATTRARNELYLTYPILRPGAHSASVLQQPSRFLLELPTDSYESWEITNPPDDVGDTPGCTANAYDPNIDTIWDDEQYLTDNS